MKNSASAFTLVLLALAMPLSDAPGQSLDFLKKIGSDIDIQGLSQEWDPETEVASVTGDVRIAYKGVVIKAKRAEFHTQTGEIKASEDVAVFQDGNLFRGDSINYNTKTGTLTSDGMRSRSGDLVFHVENFHMKSEKGSGIKGEQATITTHDHVSPSFRIKPKEVKIYPEDRIVFKSPKFYVGDVPVFWVPRFTQPLDNELGYFFTPGYNSRWGAFFNNRYGMLHGDHTMAQYHLDFMSGRGVGVGADFYSEKFRDSSGIGRLKLYHTYDIDTEFDRQSEERAELSESRYRINFQHRIYFPGPEESTFYLDFDVNKVSDRLYYQDFFFSDAGVDPHPDNVINLVKRGDRYEASLLSRFQLNDFTTQDTRLPEIALDLPTQQIWKTPLFYRGSSSWGILAQEQSNRDKDSQRARRDALREQVRLEQSGEEPGVDSIFDIENEIDRLEGLLDGEGYHRLFSYHEVLYPTRLGPLTFVPRLGGGFLYYSDIKNSSSGSSFDRGILHAGFDLSAKWTREFDVQAPKLGLDGLRHIVQPYMNYSYVNTEEDKDGRIDPRIDGNILTTKLRPIDVPLFSNIDAIDPWNIVRLGIRHTFQTRRDESTLARDKKTYAWLMFDTFMEGYIEDPEFDRDISGIHNRLKWKPVPWFSLAVDSQFPIDDNPQNFSEFNTSVSWTPHDRVNLGFKHAMLQDHPDFNDSSLFSFSSYLRLSENWGFSTSHRFEGEDGALESQAYKIHRDLTTWTASLGFVQLLNEGAEDEIGFVLSFTLKDFPSVTFPFDLNPNPANN